MKPVGYIQLYTGNGKGKTTAALGLAIRAVGAGLSVYFAQFIKGMFYSELNIIPLLGENFQLKQFGRDCFITREPEERDRELARQGMQEVGAIITSGCQDLVVLDEITIAIHFGLIDLGQVLKLCDEKAAHVELVITGRYAPQALIDRADLVTEMREIKHYYQQGVQARTGFEK